MTMKYLPVLLLLQTHMSHGIVDVLSSSGKIDISSPVVISAFIGNLVKSAIKL